MQSVLVGQIKMRADTLHISLSLSLRTFPQFENTHIMLFMFEYIIGESSIGVTYDFSHDEKLCSYRLTKGRF